MRRLNLGIVAHVDAGKTSLTERLLYNAGIIERVGSVDVGNTQTDTLALKRQRGITIRASVVSFALGDTTVNLIDTPGHSDFIAEVDRALGVLDGAVLVISAVEGVQAQARVLFRALRRLGIPVLLFVNKVDRMGAREDSLLAEIADRLTPSVVPMGSVQDIGTREAEFVANDFARSAARERTAAALAEHDPAILMRFIANEDVSPRTLRRSLERQSRLGLVHPVYFGSAITGTGVTELSDGSRRLLPASEGDSTAPLSGTVFKVERGLAGEKIAFIRLRSGSISVREVVPFGEGQSAKVSAIAVFDAHAAGTMFARPTLESVVIPVDPGDRRRLFGALTQLAEQDPLINLRQDDERRELSDSLYGEVQKEVIQATLASDFGLDVEFRESTVIHVERPNGAGEAAEFKHIAPKPFIATVGLRVEPIDGDGVEFMLDTSVLGKMPLAFYKAVEDTVMLTLRQGLHGWQVVGCRVTMINAGYEPKHSHAHQKFDKSITSTGEDFRGLSPLVLIDALRDAGTTVCEPFEEFRLELPSDSYAAVAPVLAAHRAALGEQEVRGAWSFIDGSVPSANVRALQMAIPALTRGEGVLETWPGSYEPVRGTPPERERWDQNPLDRKEYLLPVKGRI